MENKDTKERLERLNRVSDSEKALNEIMMMYFDDLDATISLAEQGNDMAQAKLGSWYHNGNGVSQDYEKAAHWYTLAARQDNTKAMNNLAVLYTKGQGVEKDVRKAIELFKKAAEQGGKVAQYNLADYYLTGNEYLKMDLKEGVRLLLRSAQQGYKPAIDYAMDYDRRNNIPELKRVYSDAFQWYKDAAAGGDTTAQKEYEDRLRTGSGTLEERISAIGEPPYDAEAEIPLSQMLKKHRNYSFEQRENIGYTCYNKFLSKPDIETFEKILITRYRKEYFHISDEADKLYARAVNENRFVSILNNNDMNNVEAVLAKPDPKPGFTRSKTFVIGAILLLPAVVPAVLAMFKNFGLWQFGLIFALSAFLFIRMKRPYGPLVQAQTEKKAAVDGFVAKYRYYINLMYNATNGSQKKPGNIVKRENGQINYVATYYSRCKILLDRYQRMEFTARTAKPKATRKPKDPRSRI